MSLRVALAAPFKQAGRDRLGENEFVVALSLERDWFSPDQAKRLVDVATGQGLLDREDGDLLPTFDVDAVEIPDGFVPDESMLVEQSTFERLVDLLVAEGVPKRDAVAGVNDLQRQLGVTVEAAAVVFARREGIDVDDLADRAMEELRSG